MQGVLPPEAVKLIAAWLQALVQGPTTRFGIGLIVSVLLALWTMWSAAGMLMAAVNICYGEEEKRGFVSFNLHALALGAGLALFGMAALALVAVLPAALALLPVPDAWGEGLGLVRWPLLAGIVILALAIVYRFAPDRAAPKWQWVSCGSAAATALWILGSLAFATYVARVGSYDKTYGSLGARHNSAAVVLSDRLRHPRRGGPERPRSSDKPAAEARDGARKGIPERCRARSAQPRPGGGAGALSSFRTYYPGFAEGYRRTARPVHCAGSRAERTAVSGGLDRPHRSEPGSIDRFGENAMPHISHDPQRQSRVMVAYDDAALSFMLSKDATFEDLAERLERLGERRRGRPLAIAVKFAAASKAQYRQPASLLGSG